VFVELEVATPRISEDSDRLAVLLFPTCLHQVNQKEFFSAFQNGLCLGKSCTKVITSWSRDNLSDRSSDLWPPAWVIKYIGICGSIVFGAKVFFSSVVHTTVLYF
jgi:hypothetical protein